MTRSHYSGGSRSLLAAMVVAGAAIAQLGAAGEPKPPAKKADAKKPDDKKPEPVSEATLPGVFIDWEHGKLLAPGSCAADLYAASADIARAKAERLARLRAEERLRKALGILTRDKEQRRRIAAFGPPEQLAQLDPASAQIASIDYGASGSVAVHLALDLRPAPPAPPAAISPQADAGATPPDAGSAAVPPKTNP